MMRYIQLLDPTAGGASVRSRSGTRKPTGSSEPLRLALCRTPSEKQASQRAHQGPHAGCGHFPREVVRERRASHASNRAERVTPLDLSEYTHLSEGWQRALRSFHAPCHQKKSPGDKPPVPRGDKSSMHVTVSSIDTNSQLGNIEFYFHWAARRRRAARQPRSRRNFLAFLGLFSLCGRLAGGMTGEASPLAYPPLGQWTFI
jgi:hypothetical protein